MSKVLGILLSVLITLSCNNIKQEEEVEIIEIIEYKEIINDNYELNKPVRNANAVLVLFGGFPEQPKDIKREFQIQEIAKKNNIAVLYMNYNQKLWINKSDKAHLEELLKLIFDDNKLPTDNIYIGGFSSGGNVTLLLSNYLKSISSSIQPKGVFIIDSPVDLLELYRLAKRNIARNFSKLSIHEANWLIKLFENEFENSENGIKKYEEFSPYTAETKNIQNLLSLKGLKIRFYSEPDTIWWEEKRKNKPTDLNAFWIEKLTIILKSKFSHSSVEYIPTKNRGYRSNGERHPHSWSIVDKKDLVEWMIKK